MPPRSRKARPASSIEADSEAQLALGVMEGLLGYHLRRAQDCMHRDFLEALAEHEITQKQAAVILLTDSNPGVSQIEIANELRMDRATMTAILDRLEARGFLQRKRSTTDRRRQQLYMTPRGQKALISMKAKIRQHEKRFRLRFSEADQATLIDLLRRLYEE
jgi:DNA-binding MarR family transcriptional regulator